jgi:LPXTG-motif cell wall-anchored protein
MRRSLLLASVALALVLPATASAKGASEATIDGPGIDALTLGKGEENLMYLAERAGLFPALFGQSPDPMLSGRPSGKLGAKYTITWLMPGPETVHRIRQDVYPYAAGGPVTYMRAGQPIFNERSRGGWFRASVGLRDQLITAGLPAKAPKTSTGNGRAYAFAGAGVAALLLAGGAFVVRRRQSNGK